MSRRYSKRTEIGFGSEWKIWRVLGFPEIDFGGETLFVCVC